MVVFIAKTPAAVVANAQAAGYGCAGLKLMDRVGGCWRLHYA